MLMQEPSLTKESIKAIESVLSKGHRAEVYQTRNEIVVKEQLSKIVHTQEK